MKKIGISVKTLARMIEFWRKGAKGAKAQRGKGAKAQRGKGTKGLGRRSIRFNFCRVAGE